MTVYSFHKTDLEPLAPRVLPAPLVAAALFISAGPHMADEVGDFLVEHGRPLNVQPNIWMTVVWDRSRDEYPIAQAAYSWMDQEVVREAVTVHDDYATLPIEEFMDGMGCALFGLRTVGPW